jgi:hypothetical protein
MGGQTIRFRMSCAVMLTVFMVFVVYCRQTIPVPGAQKANYLQSGALGSTPRISRNKWYPFPWRDVMFSVTCGCCTPPDLTVTCAPSPVSLRSVTLTHAIFSSLRHPMPSYDTIVDTWLAFFRGAHLITVSRTRILWQLRQVPFSNTTFSVAGRPSVLDGALCSVRR